MGDFLCAKLAGYTDVLWLSDAGIAITFMTTFHLKLP